MYIDQSQIEGLGTAGTPAGGVLSVQSVNAAGTTEKIDTNGSSRVVITNPTDGTLSASIAGYGRLRVTPEGTCTFIDHFDTIDANKWTAVTSGTGSISSTNSALTMVTSTGANAQVNATSVPFFEQQGNVYLEFGCNIKIEATTIISNVYRFWGLATSPSGGSTYANPIQDGIGFELDGTGVFRAVMYSAGTRTFAQILTTPTDGALRRYAFFYNTQFQYFYLQSLDVPIASSTTGLGLTTQLLPTKLLIINNSTAPTTAPTFQCAAIAVTDLGRNATAIADGVYGFRKAQVLANNQLVTTGPEQAMTNAGKYFFAGIDSTTIGTTETKLILASNPTGSGKIMKINKIRVSTYAGLGGNAVFRVYLNPTVTTNGTALTPVGNRQTGQNTAVTSFFTTPVTSASGTKVRIMQTASTGDENEIYEDFSLWLEPGNKLMITGQGSATALAIVTLLFAED